MNKLVKIDRVSSLQEAENLERLGASILCFDLRHSQPQFSDVRRVDRTEAKSICDALRNARSAVHVSLAETSPEDAIAVALECKAHYIQLSAVDVPEPRFSEKCIEAGTAIIFSSIQASYDDDPSWILSRYSELDRRAIGFFQIELLTTVQDAWYRSSSTVSSVSRGAADRRYQPACSSGADIAVVELLSVINQ